MIRCNLCGTAKEGSGQVLNECDHQPDYSKEGFIHIKKTNQYICNDCRQYIYDDIHDDEKQSLH